MAGSPKVRVTYKLDRSALRRIQNRSKGSLQTWARDVLRRITPTVPIDSGRLRRAGDTLVEGGERLTIWWYWPGVEYAGRVERMREFGKSPKVAGTRAPFAVPGVKEAIPTIGEPIRKGFEGD